ncbi:MAG: DegT/DnrJ/EryC1/StrS family aminotransferase [Bryobacteraceae bacterium]|nr:DegT/DnrJ/EryC1/StrS family aminotransferase [Bryobacteraceae bacterium]
MKQTLLRRTFVGVASAVALRGAPGRKTTDRPALLGGEPVRAKRFPGWPQVRPEDEKPWLDALRACGWWRKQGHYVNDFEKAWAKRMGARYCVATANGTGALMAALNAVEVGPKDEVLVTPYTFIATINSILAHFALPVFVDTDRETHMIDAGKIEAAITDRTRCIMPVHLGGNVADMDKILAISKKRGIPVVEDACQAHLSEWRNKPVSTLGDLGCFSFQRYKNLPGGEAGGVVTNDEKLYLHAYGYHSHYRTPDENAADPAICRNGINLRMSEFQAAALTAQMTRIEENARKRDANAALLNRLLEDVPGVAPVKMYPGCTRNAYHLYMMRYEPERFAGMPRDRFLKAMNAEGIPVGAGYEELNKYPFLENTLNSRAFRAVYAKKEVDHWRERNHCPVNTLVTREAMWMSQSVLLGEASDMEDIALAMRKVQQNAEAIKRG